MMKNKLFFLLAMVLLCTNLTFSQTDSKGFNFQGYAIDPDGKAMGSSNITVKFTIYTTEKDYYSEELNLVTDIYGIFNAVIGSKSPTNFAKLNFYTTLFKLKVEVKKSSGGVYTTISDGVFQSVPYARSAANGVPVGTIVAFGGASDKIPDGWLLCDWRELDGTDPKYVQLFEVIGTSWGGSGTKFRLPELRGWFLRGLDPGNSYDPDAADRFQLGTGTKLGQAVGSYENGATAGPNNAFYTSSNGNHNHAYDQFDVQTYSDGVNTGASIDNTPGEINIVTPRPMKSAGDHIHSIASGGDKETRPRNAAVNYIIKY